MPARNHMRKIREVVEVSRVPRVCRLLQTFTDLPKFPRELLRGMPGVNQNLRKPLQKLARVADTAPDAAVPRSRRRSLHRRIPASVRGRAHLPQLGPLCRCPLGLSAHGISRGATLHPSTPRLSFGPSRATKGMCAPTAVSVLVQTFGFHLTPPPGRRDRRAPDLL